ncbi:unnamed protein product [Blepharisma stoltei]|uniref:Kelch motif family protein n=1 Tax=Blepharisma stoltei TaxID=1481888 RepID=A0AAU9JHJ3_9CILI|nr:unnamed protein product [Blepharisma stoltei]
MMEERKKKLPDIRIFVEKINTARIIIPKIDQEIKDFVSLFDLSEDEEKIDKIRCEIIDEYKLLRASTKQFKETFEILLQVDTDTEFNDIYSNYTKEFTSLAQNYKSFMKQSVVGSRTLSICFKTADGLGLQIYDLQTQKSQCLPSESFLLGACIVSLPNSQLFIYSSGNPNYCVGIPCILDLHLKTKIEVPKVLDIQYPGGAYYRNSVYLFGGATNHQIFDEAWRFDLEKKIWFHVPSLPDPSTMCACTVFKDSILICGVGHRQIYKYDVKIQSYSKIDAVKVETFTPRVLFKAGSRVYFLERGGIFESELENEYAYTRIRNNELEWGSVSQVKFYDGNIWFITGGNKNFKVFKFDLATKHLENIL